ncbi:hypothetical protein H9P43_002688 [Blastocladiella emersonii ATCC 22665]|nr:hypothetical protein H9P43_002688 [Blastocladiella emersonii ATCC 22665]
MNSAAARKAAATALSLGELAGLLKGIAISPTEKLAVAVSGGPDSMALLYLLNQWAPGRVHALTVDHKIRPESTEEAVRVQGMIRAQGIPADVLTVDWRDTPLDALPSAQLEDKARLHRYRLLAHACREHGASKLFVGHHLNDQIETVLYRLARGSGLGGLGGMTHGLADYPVVQHPRDRDVKLVRPLLSVPKDRLVETCRALGIDAVTDPMNRDLHYQRNVIRGVLASASADPNAHPMLSEASLATFCDHMREYSTRANGFTAKVLAESVLTDELTGSAFLNLPHLAKHHDHWFHRTHLATSALSAIVRWLDCSAYPPPIGSVAQVRDAMLAYYVYGLDGNAVPEPEPSADPATPPPQIRWVPPPREHEFKTMSLCKSLVLPPRPDRNGPGNWVFVRAPPIASVRNRDRIPLSRVAPVLFDNRFFVKLAPPTVSGDDPRLQLAMFYRSLASHLPPRNSIALVSAEGEAEAAAAVVSEGPNKAARRKERETAAAAKDSAAKPQFELIVRYMDREDEAALAGVFRRRHQHPAWAQYRRAWEHYKFKMPFVSRYAVPVIALRRRDWDSDAAKASPLAPPAVSPLEGSNAARRNVGNKSTAPGTVVSKATVDTGLGALVAVPCLSINLMPEFFSYEVSYRTPLVKPAQLEAVE